MSIQQRYTHFDNLRGLAMLAGVIFHAGLAYSPMARPVWPTADVVGSSAIDAVLWFLHLFRMPVFFLLAGFFAARTLENGGLRVLLKSRIKRVLIPLLLFWPILYLMMDWIIQWAVQSVDNQSPILKLIAVHLSNPESSTPPPTLMHLWFLYYLCLFYVFVWITRTLEWRLPIVSINTRPAFLLLGVPLLLSVGLIFAGIPFSAPESIFPQWWAVLIFGTFFALGMAFWQSNEWLTVLNRHRTKLLLASILLYAALFYLMQSSADISNPTLQRLLMMAFLESCIATWMTIWCVLAAQQYLSKQNRLFGALATSSYWIYLIHLPLLFVVQFILLDYSWHWLSKLFISIISTILVALVLEWIVVRPTPLRIVLLPRKHTLNQIEIRT
jgi:glucans biosynthesis protein C